MRPHQLRCLWAIPFWAAKRAPLGTLVVSPPMSSSFLETLVENALCKSLDSELVKSQEKNILPLVENLLPGRKVNSP